MRAAALLATLLVLRNLARPNGVIVSVVLVPTALVAAAAAYAVWAKRSRLELRSGLLVRRGLFRSTTVRISDLAVAVRFTVTRPLGRSTRRLCLVDDHGRAVVRWTTALWPEDAMARLLSALDVELDDVPEPLTPRECEEEWAGSSSWLERHPWAFGFLGTALIGVVVVTALALLGGF